MKFDIQMHHTTGFSKLGNNIQNWHEHNDSENKNCLTYKSDKGKSFARCGVLKTAHGKINTPIFCL